MQHAFHLGQLVRVVKSTTVSRDNRIYCIVSLMRSEADGDPAYRIKNASGLERVVGPDEIEPAALNAVP